MVVVVVDMVTRIFSRAETKAPAELFETRLLDFYIAYNLCYS